MAWTSPRTWVAGETVTAAVMNTHVRDNLKAIGDPLTAYGSASSWTASTTNPVLNNGTWDGRFSQAGKWVEFRVTITMGSTTTFGSGQYSLALPAAAHGTGIQAARGDAFIGGAAYDLRGRIPAGGSTVLLYCTPTAAGTFDRTVTPTTPGTWANGNTLTMTGGYEAA